ncbi:MAG: hypothetical protein LBB12_02375 [Holosporaceae bacterium]|jgi:hypothetical protein|nr:hypothetical protein [Holosporaceae bacterium]
MMKKRIISQASQSLVVCCLLATVVFFEMSEASYNGAPGAPNARTPYGGVPNAGLPYGVVPNTGLPYGGMPNTGTPYGGMPNTAYAGVPYAGVPYAGVPNAGMQNTGANTVSLATFFEENHWYSYTPSGRVETSLLCRDHLLKNFAEEIGMNTIYRISGHELAAYVKGCYLANNFNLHKDRDLIGRLITYME